jgi:hypothetical protein
MTNDTTRHDTRVGERSFAIKVDPTVLEAGSHHYGEIVAIDVSQPEAGPVFKVPVTVIRPLRIERGPGTHPSHTPRTHRSHRTHGTTHAHMARHGTTHAQTRATRRTVWSSMA